MVNCSIGSPLIVSYCIHQFSFSAFLLLANVKGILTSVGSPHLDVTCHIIEVIYHSGLELDDSAPVFSLHTQYGHNIEDKYRISNECFQVVCFFFIFLLFFKRRQLCSLHSLGVFTCTSADLLNVRSVRNLVTVLYLK